MSSSRSSQFVEVHLEIGHRATVRTKQNTAGHTHDWTVFVRGPENNNIQHFVEKVVFYLHESFPKPKRVIKEPPYEVSESGYASFELPIEVYFKNKDEPKKISFEYDLYLRTDMPVANTRREKLTFQNPTNDFKKKLLRAGGVTNESSGTTAKAPNDERLPSSSNASKTSKSTHAGGGVENTNNKKTKSAGVIPSKDKSLNSTSSSTSSSNHNNGQEKPNNPVTHSQFTDLFGPPIQARPSSDHSNYKNKDNSSHNKSLATKESANEKNKSSNKGSSLNLHSHDNEKSNKNKNITDIKSSSKGSNSKTTKESSKTKYDKKETSSLSKKKKASQMASSPVSSVDSNGKKTCDTKGSTNTKRRRSTSSTSSSITCNSYAESESFHRDHSPKTASSKEHDSKKESKKQKTLSKDVVNSGSGVKKESSTSTKISFSNSNSSTTIEIKSVKKEKLWDSELKKSKSKEFKTSEVKSSRESSGNSGNNVYASNSGKSKPKDESILPQKSPKMYGNKHLKVPKEKYASTHRETSISPSSFSGSLTPGGVVNSSTSTLNPSFSAMIADTIGHESLSPLSSNPPSPLHFEPQSNIKNLFDDSDSDQSPKRQCPSSTGKTFPSQITPNKSHQNLKRKHDSPKIDSSSDLKTKSAVKEHMTSDSASSKLFREHNNNNNNFNDLIELQQRINDSTDADILQKIVDIIEESAAYHITNTTFDFDLMKLDHTTVRKLKTCFS